MKKDIPDEDDEMPAEFDFSRSISNPWFVAVHGPEYVRVIDKDLAALFPDNDSVNAALRSDPLDQEINLRKSRPNPYWLGVVDRRCVRLLESDLADAFPDDAAVNEALRTVRKVATSEPDKK